MLEEIFEDDLIGDPNDLDEIIEQQGDVLLDEAEEEETEDNANNGMFSMASYTYKQNFNASEILLRYFVLC